MKLSLLLKHIFPIPERFDCEVLGLNIDSRTIQKGEVFVALQGQQHDARQFIDDAITKGAVAILCEANENALDEREIKNGQSIPIISLCLLAKNLSLLAAAAFNHPSQDLTVIGITGTNGKTSICHFIAYLLQRFNIAYGVIGTLGNGKLGALCKTEFTTPDAISSQKILAEFKQKQLSHVVMEVSSHALSLGRVTAVDFDIAIFSNLTRDHLDFHGDMQHYAAAKAQLFKFPNLKYVILNADDTFCHKLAKEIAKEVAIYWYSVKTKSALSQHHIIAKKVTTLPTGLSAEVTTPWGEVAISVPLYGLFNIHNVLAALTCLAILKMPLPEIAKQLTTLPVVPGRMQLVSKDSQQKVFVDYSHTPDALAHALQELRLHFNDQKVICVFGCGGDRDKGKRAEMGAIAEKYADQIIITNDNPRTEDPVQIVNAIKSGIKNIDKVTIEYDRKEAIRLALQRAEQDTVILIAGKGHEDYQIIGREKHHFSDIETVTLFIANCAA